MMHRVNSYQKRTKVQDLTMDQLLLTAKYFSYNHASRYLNVTLKPLMVYMEKNHPDLHQQILENGKILKSKRNANYLREIDYGK